MGGCCNSKGQALENPRTTKKGVLDIMLEKPTSNTINIKVGTYDLSNFTDHPNWDKRVHAIANLIKESDCDIVAL